MGQTDMREDVILIILKQIILTINIIYLYYITDILNITFIVLMCKENV